MIAAVAFRLYIVSNNVFTPLAAELGPNSAFAQDQCEAMKPIVQKYLNDQESSFSTGRVVFCMPYKFGAESTVKTFDIFK